jgi:hypothetical protein
MNFIDLKHARALTAHQAPAAIAPQAYFTGKNEFWFDPHDALRNGFILR